MIAPPPPDATAVAMVFQSTAAPPAIPEPAIPEPAIPEPAIPEPAVGEPAIGDPVADEPEAAPPSLPLPRDLPKLALTKPPPPPKPARASQIRSVPPPSLPASTAAPAEPTPVEPTPAIDPSWQSSVAAWLVAHKTYPDGARRRQEEGRVAVSFTVDRVGRVLAVEVAESSRSERLDEATLALLRNASLPAFPPSMAQARVTVTMTVRFTLR